jgi:hypothetical protein
LKISDRPSPIADLEHRFAFSTIDGNRLGIDKDVAKGCSKLAIGDG